MPDCTRNPLGLSQAVKHDKANTRKFCVWQQPWFSCACLQARLCFTTAWLQAVMVLSSTTLTLSAEHRQLLHHFSIYKKALPSDSRPACSTNNAEAAHSVRAATLILCISKKKLQQQCLCVLGSPTGHTACLVHFHVLHRNSYSNPVTLKNLSQNRSLFQAKPVHSLESCSEFLCLN